jgi:branched-chain amino acid transport system ATP-binding protein
MSSDTLLEVTNLTSGYDGVPAIRNVSLDVGPGEIVAVLGANGAGKTTTLCTIAGLLTPFSGDVRLGDQDALKMSVRQRAAAGLGFVPDDRGLFADLTVAENLRVARGTRPVAELFGWFPALASLMQRKAGLLSGGEQQMLAMARAIARRPALLLIDEMSLGLAPIIVSELLKLLAELAVSEGTAVLLVEQHVDLALEHAHRAYLLSHGELIAEGKADELLRNRALLESGYLADASIGDAQLTSREE